MEGEWAEREESEFLLFSLDKKNSRQRKTHNFFFSLSLSFSSLSLPLILTDRLVQQLGHRLVVDVVLPLRPRLDEPVVLELGRRRRAVGGREPFRPEGRGLALQVGERHAADARDGAAEGRVDDVGAQAVRFEDLRAVVARQQRDAHLRQDLEQSFLDRLFVVGLRLGDRDVGGLACLDERDGARGDAPLAGGLEGEVGADGVSTCFFFFFLVLSSL